ERCGSLDNLLLRRLLAELAPCLEGLRVDSIYALPKDHLAIVLGCSGAPRLWFSSEPDEPHFYWRRGPHPTPPRPPAFAMAARKLLSGRRIVSCEALGGDKVIALRCSGRVAGTMIFELIPRRATALLLGADGVIRAVWHRRRGRPTVGDAYKPPDRPTRQSINELGDDDWKRLESLGEPRALSRGLMATIGGISTMVAREAICQHAAGMALEVAVREQIERAESEPTAACIYAPLGLGELKKLPAAQHFLLAPYPLQQASNLTATPFASLAEAAETYYPLRARLQLLDRVRHELATALEIKSARTARTREAVRADHASLQEPQRYRRWADLLLAHPDAEKEDGRVTVTDAYAGGEPLQIPVDPAKTLVANANAYYQRARRAERSARRTRQRLAALEGRTGDLAKLRAHLSETPDLDTCLQIARQASRHGVTVERISWQAPEAKWPKRRVGAENKRMARPSTPSRKPATAAARTLDKTSCQRPHVGGSPPGPARRVEAGIWGYRSADGQDILVGRNAAANERLTHRLAAPHDWWLHAEGPGAHVIIRNPGRCQEPPVDSLRQAAALAAYFSFAREATKVNVRWTQVRHLRRPRAGARGQVIVKRAQTVLAEPLSPEELFA
ncbi:MAG: NFACT RNA binding domain-containing protein, partial [Acidobacteriota bacterium]